MKKCGIATIIGDDNYGNRLQNYALQKTVNKCGFLPETIRYLPVFPKENQTGESRHDKLLNWGRKSPKIFAYDLRRALKKRVYHRLYGAKIAQRAENFKSFENENIVYSKEEYSARDDLRGLDGQYDAYLAGSDQIWNPYWEGINPFYFLDFVKGKNKFAYAASFGVSDIPQEQRAYYRNMLGGLPVISVREHSGLMIIKSLTGRTASVMPDPTLLLSREEWLRVSKKAHCRTEKKYLLTYFLGKQNLEMHSAVKSYAKKYHLRLIALNDIRDPKAYSCGPAEFVDLFAHAQLVCTDSFHGSVFSMIFNRPFLVFERESENNSASMFSRIETLLMEFGLQNCKYTKTGQIDRLPHVDFSRANSIISTKREEAFSFLKNAFIRLTENEKTERTL
jgi:hypothetical protein